jgi:hypothetical protein
MTIWGTNRGRDNRPYRLHGSAELYGSKVGYARMYTPLPTMDDRTLVGREDSANLGVHTGGKSTRKTVWQY